MTVPTTFRYAARSDVGLVRSDNQDSGYAGPHLLVVADGMGGHAGGDLASSTAIAAMAAIDGDSLTSGEASDALDHVSGAKAMLADASGHLDRALASISADVADVERLGATDQLTTSALGAARVAIEQGTRARSGGDPHAALAQLVGRVGRPRPDEAADDAFRLVDVDRQAVGDEEYFTRSSLPAASRCGADTSSS